MKSLLAKIKLYIKLTRLDKPIGTFLLLWPTLIGLWLAANGIPRWDLIAVFAVGTLLMRSAGCAVNDFADRNFDSKVSRTKMRPLATKAITATEALLVFLVLTLIAFTMALLTLQATTMLLTIPTVALAAGYPFVKRFNHMPQLILAMAFSCGILMAFFEVQQQLPLVAWLLFAANVAWVVAYDTMYALADINDDKVIGVKSSAILFGKHVNAICLGLQLLMLTFLISIGVVYNFNNIYYLSLLISLLLICYQQFLLYQQQYIAAFKNNNYIGMIVFIAIAYQFI